MENLLPLAATAAAGTLPGMEAPDAPIPMVAVSDIAAFAARELVAPQHRGPVLLHAPQHVTMRQAAAAIAQAIGNPDLRYLQLPAAQVKAQLLGQGFSADAADQLEALAQWLSTSALSSACAAPAAVQPTTIEVFAQTRFAPALRQLAA
jgi:uncharacterized protein YbjT (DUF2867 family)